MYVTVEGFEGANGGVEYVISPPMFSVDDARRAAKYSEAERVYVAALVEDTGMKVI